MTESDRSDHVDEADAEVTSQLPGAEEPLPETAAEETSTEGDSTPSPESGSTASANPGWHPDPHGVATYRWWDGTRWTQQTSPGATAQPASALSPQAIATTGATTPKPTGERKALLANAIQSQVVGGGRVESQSDFQAVIVRGHRVNHALHFLVGLFTLGLWWIGWLVVAITGGEKRQMVTVDEFGNVLVQRI